jgi:hypothetical protein
MYYLSNIEELLKEFRGNAYVHFNKSVFIYNYLDQ